MNFVLKMTYKSEGLVPRHSVPRCLSAEPGQTARLMYWQCEYPMTSGRACNSFKYLELQKNRPNFSSTPSFSGGILSITSAFPVENSGESWHFYCNLQYSA